MPATLISASAVAPRTVALAAAKPRAAVVAAPHKNFARFAAAAGLALTLAVGQPAFAAAPADLAGQTITELELLTPVIEEANADGKLATVLGADEAKEVVMETVSLEKEAAAMEKKMDETVGADTEALDKAVVPLKARVDGLARLVALVGANN